MTSSIGGVSGLGQVDLKELSQKNPLDKKGDAFAQALDKELMKGDESTDPTKLKVESLQKEVTSANPEASKSTKPILKFSNHALERMNTRGIHVSAEQITKIEQAMQKASDKGAKETLVLTDTSAMIVSLKNNMVVTVMGKDQMKENIFTNIDSTVVV